MSSQSTPEGASAAPVPLPAFAVPMPAAAVPSPVVAVPSPAAPLPAAAVPAPQVKAADRCSHLEMPAECWGTRSHRVLNLCIACSACTGSQPQTELCLPRSISDARR